MKQNALFFPSVLYDCSRGFIIYKNNLSMIYIASVVSSHSKMWKSWHRLKHEILKGKSAKHFSVWSNIELKNI